MSQGNIDRVYDELLVTLTRLVFVVTFLVSALTFYAAYQAFVAEGLRETML